MSMFEKQDNAHVIGESEIVNKYELAKMLQVSLSTIQRMATKGMPFIQFKNMNGYVVKDVNEWLNSNGYKNYGQAQELRERRRKQLESMRDANINIRKRDKDYDTN